MSLDKAIQHGKEKRKPYYRSGRFDSTCRPGGSCPYCQRNRSYQYRKELARTAVPEDYPGLTADTKALIQILIGEIKNLLTA